MRCRSLSYQLQCSNSTHGRGGEDIGIDRRNWFGSGVKLGVNYWSLGRRQEKACASTPQNRRFLMTHAVDGASWINSTVATLLCGVAFRSQPGALRRIFQSPHGSLVQVTMAPHFECDASDIEGISSSKSEDMPHESVDVFGAYYIDEQNRYARKGKPPLGLDDASLKELCSHGEIRLMHGRGSDTFSVRAWDGRFSLITVADLTILRAPCMSPRALARAFTTPRNSISTSSTI